MTVQWDHSVVSGNEPEVVVVVVCVWFDHGVPLFTFCDEPLYGFSSR